MLRMLVTVACKLACCMGQHLSCQQGLRRRLQCNALHVLCMACAVKTRLHILSRLHLLQARHYLWAPLFVKPNSL